ncbi:transporter substrate-binding domain-containing protein [Saxibacter everestensis]|uniref:Transporter substrate-binding domain-containing protein n=1 Tax=Saxibacter everestensis TaxID=2909229 RepID=A0ABY8QW97_9MICO|nr:transporter substrate-binding domain-containing protein [Brevibacteriaceae bacterium ZFBP1038]
MKLNVVAPLAFTVSLVVLAGCSSAADEGSQSASSGKPSVPVSVKVDDSVASQVPDDFAKGVNVAVYSDWAPEEYVEGNQFKGWSVEMAELMSQKMGVGFSYDPSGFDAIIPGLENNRYDIAVASLGVTDERLKSLDFVPLQKEGTAFAWKKGNSSAAVDALDEVCGRSVAVLTGAWEYDYLTSHNKEVCGDKPMDIQQFKDQPSAELAVSSGRVELVAAGSGKLGYAAKQSGALEVGDFIVDPVYNGIGVPKGSELGPVLRDALQSLIDDGTYAKIRANWAASEVGNLDRAVLITEEHPKG